MKILKDFLSTKGTKNGKISCCSIIRKCFDATFRESKESKEPLPRSFYTDMGIYLMSFKKRAAKANESEDIDENESDRIPFSLCNYSCE